MATSLLPSENILHPQGAQNTKVLQISNKNSSKTTRETKIHLPRLKNPKKTQKSKNFF